MRGQENNFGRQRDADREMGSSGTLEPADGDDGVFKKLYKKILTPVQASRLNPHKCKRPAYVPLRCQKIFTTFILCNATPQPTNFTS